MDNNENNTNRRLDWHLTEMQQAWKIARNNAKVNFQSKCATAMETRKLNDNIARDHYEMAVQNNKAEYERIVEASRQSYNEEILEISRRQDEYMQRFREYVATLPEADRIAVIMEQKGYKQ